MMDAQRPNWVSFRIPTHSKQPRLFDQREVIFNILLVMCHHLCTWHIALWPAGVAVTVNANTWEFDVASVHNPCLDMWAYIHTYTCDLTGSS